MNLHPLPPDVLRIGQPTHFALRDVNGRLLLPKGGVVGNDAQMRLLLARGAFVDDRGAEAIQRALAGKVDELMRGNQSLGRIAQARPDADDVQQWCAPPRQPDDRVSAWSDLQERVAAMLRDPSAAAFPARVQGLRRAIIAQLDLAPDDALLFLFHRAGQDYRDYSASHATLVAVLCELAARQLGQFDAPACEALGCAALTMNIAMAALQNQLAEQPDAPSPLQREQIEGHAARGADLLRRAGVADALWIDAVAQHRDAPAGTLADAVPAQRIARLIRRADIFVARLRPRRSRPALTATAAAKAAFLDESGQPDEAGSAIIKATGMYPPGTAVRLAAGEAAVVLRRGRRANAPLAAAVINAAGEVMMEPVLRHTQLHPHTVAGALAPHELRVRLNLAQLMKLA